VILSLLTGAYVNVILFEPMADPLTSHWYMGADPWFTGSAVNVTWVPAQTSLLSAIILTLTGRFGFTVMGLTLLTAVAGHWRLEVSCRLTLFPLANVVVVKVGVVTPVLVPSTSQSYNGLDPPFSILDAEKVTSFPSQVGLADATIVMTGVSVGFT